MQQKSEEKVKQVTKGRFSMQFPTNARVWMNDQEWKKRANEGAWKAQEQYEASDFKMMEKRKNQKVL